MKPIVCTTLIFLCIACLLPAAKAATISSDIVFSKSGQNMWGAGDSWTFDKSLFVGWDPSPWTDGLDLLWDGGNIGLEVKGTLDFKAGLDLGMKIDSGSVNIRYPIGVNLTFPEVITEGQMITIGSSFELQGGASLGTTFPSITPKADAVLEVNANLRATGCYLFDCTSWTLFNKNVSYRKDLLEALGIPTASGDSITFDLSFGSIEVTIPGDLDTIGHLEGSSLVAQTGEFAGEFLDARLNLLSLGELIPGPVGLAFKAFNELEEGGHYEHWEPLGIDILAFNVWWNLIDLDIGAIARITQDFEFVPDKLMVDLVTNQGDAFASFEVGKSVEVTVPQGGLELTPVFTLENTFTNETGVRFDPVFNVLLLEFDGFLTVWPVGIHHQSIGFGPVLDKEWIINGPDIPLFTNDFSVDFGQVRGGSFYLGTEVMPLPGQVPEPGSLVLFGSGIIALAITVRMRRRK
ncbi:MAG: PEP-CTERM sorting domain-containing protein [Acidobacteria bacterium]|nr:PEP-CTERM sorting domain-containing protein [Acidobacteriota bacterium]